jgi:hypothetical protein
MLTDYEKSHTAFYTELGIKKPYFYDILKGKVNPPPPQKQFRIIKILKPEPEICEEFFELAAKERNEMPADLMYYIDKSMRFVCSIICKHQYCIFIHKHAEINHNYY